MNAFEGVGLDEAFRIPGGGFEGPSAVDAPIGIGQEEQDEFVFGLVLGLPLGEVGLEEVDPFLFRFPGHDAAFGGEGVPGGTRFALLSDRFSSGVAMMGSFVGCWVGSPI